MFASNQLTKQLKFKPKYMLELIFKASICHKSELPPKNVYHWPYETKAWTFANFWLDPFTFKKFNENTRVIQVEGNVASGKKEFAMKLADELGMKYIPPVDLESYYINDHGYDYRALNPLLPERLRLCDWGMFHENPSRHSVIHMQHILFKLRTFQYVKALQHIFNTGQGVVLTRSPFTERVFVEAMHNIGWLPMGYVRDDGVRFYDYKIRYNYIRNLTLAEMLKPHLTIYLDTPVDICMDRIKKSSNPMIANSKALVPEFLEAIEKAYKDVVLPRQESNGHLLKYEHEKPKTDAEMRDIIDDIKPLEYEFDPHDSRFQDWDYKEYAFWHFTMRRRFTTIYCINHLEHLHQPWFDIAGLGDSITETDLRLRLGLFEGHVGPIGKFNSFDTDLRIQGPAKVFFNKLNFGEQLNKLLRSDYV